MKPTRHSFIEIYVHLVWSTSRRMEILGDAFWSRAKEDASSRDLSGGFAICELGGVDDHVHVLVQLRPDVHVAHVIQRLKGSWSFWLRREGGIPDFKWQEGYAAISVSPDGLEAVRAYIVNQREHHASGDLHDGMELAERKG